MLELEQLNTKKSLQAVVLMLLMYLIDVEMRRGERSQPKLVIIDEAWDLMVPDILLNLLKPATAALVN